MTIAVNYQPSTYDLIGFEFICRHDTTHQEEAITSCWSPEIENSIDVGGLVDVCNDCGDEA